ncbi:tetratricopeptide repeat protein [Microcoleus sp. B6-A1]|uniref:tetratricopeptide repeat protein n=1 Tax=Microcoleus sp. B6-A1 TaxID=2818684 RepID=UPI002FD2F6B2
MELNIAQQLFTEGNFEGAIAACEAVLRLNPDCAPAYKIIGNVLHSQGNFSAARDFYVKALEIQPDFAEVIGNIGTLYTQQGQWPEAIALYERAIRLQPNFTGAYRNLARTWQQLGFLAQASDCWLQALTLEPENTEAQQVLVSFGNLLLEQGKIEESLTCYSRVLQVAPHLTDIRNQLDAILIKQGKESKSTTTVSLYLKVIEWLKPESIDYYHQLGEILLKVRQGQLWDLTILTYRRILEHSPNHPWVHHFLGDALWQTQQWHDAISSYRKALESNPNFSWSYHNLGDALLKVQDWQGAIVANHRAIELNPSYIWSFHNLGEALINTQHWQESIAAYEGALALDSNFIYSRNRLGEAYFQLGMLQIKQNDLNLALQSYQKSIEFQPNQIKNYSALQQDLARGFYQLAVKQAEQGELDTALTFFKKAPQIPQKWYIYEYLWQGLNLLGVIDENSPYCCSQSEIKPEDAESYFSQNSNYRLIMWDSITDLDKDFLEKSGISLTHLELIKQDTKVLEEIYVNSFREEDSMIEIPIKATNYNLFNQSIVTTGYIYSMCPFSGNILRSNQSFYDVNWLPIFSYRFVGHEVFYLMTGHFWGGKICLYIPRIETIIGFAYVHNTLEGIVNRLKSSMVSYWQDVKSYITSGEVKPVVSVSGILGNIGHYFWNEVSGIHDLYENGNLAKVDKFLVGCHEYFKISDIFPEEIPESKVIRLSDGWSIFKAILQNNYMAVRSAGILVKDKLADKIYEGSIRRSSPAFLQQVEKAKQHFPLLWIGIRTNQRVWVSQTEGIANIINSLYVDFPSMAVVLDGWSRIERDDYYGGTMIESERPIADQILSMIPPEVKIYDIIGGISYEKVVWGYNVDTYVTSLGSGNAFVTWIANKPGVGLGNKEFCVRVRPDLLGRENIVMPNTIPDDAFIDLDESVHYLSRNYDCDWKAVYKELLNVIKDIKR